MIYSSMQACVFDASKVEVVVKNGYLDVKVVDGNVQLLLCLGLNIADNIVSRMESALMDAQRQAHPETAQGEAEAVEVLDVEHTMSPEALRGAPRGK